VVHLFTGLLEAELLEEPLVLASLVLFLQDLLDLLLGSLLGSSILQSFRVHGILEINVKVVASRHHVGVVDELDEGLNVGATSDALSTHRLGNL
jgi:hypothetical protein